MANTICAGDLELGDMVNLHEDPIFDPDCVDEYCVHLTQDAQLVEIEVVEPHMRRLTFVNQPGNDPVEGRAYYSSNVHVMYSMVQGTA